MTPHFSCWITCYLFTHSFLTISAGIMVHASRTTAIQPLIPNGTQLNISPIHWNGASGTIAAFTSNLMHDYNNQKYFNKIFILIQTGKIANPSSRTLKPLNKAATINSTK